MQIDFVNGLLSALRTLSDFPSRLESEEITLICLSNIEPTAFVAASAHSAIRRFELSPPPFEIQSFIDGIVIEAISVFALYRPNRHCFYLRFLTKTAFKGDSLGDLHRFLAENSENIVYSTRIFFFASPKIEHLKSLISAYFAAPISAIEHFRFEAPLFALKATFFIFRTDSVDLTTRFVAVPHVNRRPIFRGDERADRFVEALFARLIAQTDLSPNDEPSVPTLLYSIALNHRLAKLNKKPQFFFVIFNVSHNENDGFAFERSDFRDKLLFEAEKAFALFKFKDQSPLLDTREQNRKRATIGEEVALCVSLIAEIEALLGTDFIAKNVPNLTGKPTAEAITEAILSVICRF